MTADLSAYVRECRSCGAPIIWARTLTGRAMPVNAEPKEGGNVELSLRQGHMRATVHTTESVARHLGPQARSELRLAHFATCPQASLWRI
jgi:hypothetical protein